MALNFLDVQEKITYIVGDLTHYTLENIVFNALSFISALVTLFISIKEIFYWVSVEDVLISIIPCIVFSIFYILGKKRIAVSLLAWLYLIVLTLIIFADWFLVSGVYGMAWVLFTTLIAITQAIFSGRHLLFANMWNILVMFVIYSVSQTMPQLVAGLVSSDVNVTYFIFDVALITLGLGFAIYIVMRSFRQQNNNILTLNNNLKTVVGTLESKNIELSNTKKDLMHARDEANNANKAKTDFLSGMSHEIRTPLNAIIGFSQVLEVGSTDKDVLDNAKEITLAGKYILDLTDDILDISKIEAGKIILNITACNLNVILEESIAIITPSANKRVIRIENKVSNSSKHTLHVDEMRFRQILLNLLSNAVKYNLDKGKITIECLEQDNNMLKFSISDTGVGITDDEQKKLFTPFERSVAENSNIKGTGLGLVISKKLVEQMGGAIGIESKVGKGSCFWITLPLKP